MQEAAAEVVVVPGAAAVPLGVDGIGGTGQPGIIIIEKAVE